MNLESSALFWLTLNILSIVTLSYFSMMEMACVSFNKVRLQYYVAKGEKHANLLNNLLQDPSKLFGATLVGVNVALVFGSEFARQFHSAIGINPDFAPLSQVIIVVIFGELAPMFAARRYAEHMALLGIRLLSAFATLISPLLWAITLLTKLTSRLLGSHVEENSNFFLTQEEIQKLIEEQSDEPGVGAVTSEFNAIVSNIFNLRSKTAAQVMTPLSSILSIPANYTVTNVRNILQSVPEQLFLPIYHQNTHNIVGIVYPRDLLRESGNQRVRSHARAPWFVTSNAEIMQILKQFRRNNQNVAIVLDEKGQAFGVLTLDDIIEEIFGTIIIDSSSSETKDTPIIEKTVPGQMKISDFNRLYHTHIESEEETFEELITAHLGHNPEEGEMLYIPNYEIIIKKTSLLEIKSLTIRTRME